MVYTHSPSFEKVWAIVVPQSTVLFVTVGLPGQWTATPTLEFCAFCTTGSTIRLIAFSVSVRLVSARRLCPPTVFASKVKV